MNFDLDRAGLAELLSAPEAVAALTDVAHEVASEWERNDPRNKPGGHEPPKIQVGSASREDGVAVVPVYTDDGIWHILEYGSANNPPYRPATRAALNAGLDFKDDRG